MAKLTNMDPNQIVRSQHDEENSANRVVIVGGDFGIADAVKESLKDIKLEIPQQKQEQPFIIEKEVIVKEAQIIHVPQIIKETEIKVIEIEKPVIVSEIKLIEVQVPVIQREVQVVEKQVIVKELKDYDKYVKALLAIHVIGLIALIISLFK